jgi:hypothetical protein
MDTVLVFPDYKLVTNVERSKGGAEILYQAHLDQGLDRAGASVEGSIKSWTLPYHAVILLCSSFTYRLIYCCRLIQVGSHRRRDTRCGVAAPKLEAGIPISQSTVWTIKAHPQSPIAFTRKLSHHGWDVHTQLEDICCNGPPLEELPGSHTDREAETNNRIRSLEEVEQKKALILKISHIGGHKFAGNVIVSCPIRLSSNDPLHNCLRTADLYSTRSRNMVWAGFDSQYTCNSGKHYFGWEGTTETTTRRAKPLNREREDSYGVVAAAYQHCFAFSPSTAPCTRGLWI